MKDERTLSFKMSQQITKDDLQNVSAAGWTNSWTANATYNNGAYDGCIDVSVDM